MHNGALGALPLSICVSDEEMMEVLTKNCNKSLDGRAHTQHEIEKKQHRRNESN